MADLEQVPIIWIVESQRLDGRWGPLKSPDKPFTHEAAMKEMGKLKKKFPMYKHRFRVTAYEQVVALLPPGGSNARHDPGAESQS
jgi:hypothetical protein